jgi:hypothetical protein
MGFTRDSIFGPLKRSQGHGPLGCRLYRQGHPVPSRRRGSPRPPAASSCGKTKEEVRIKAQVELEQGRDAVSFVSRIFNADFLRDQLAQSDKSS